MTVLNETDGVRYSKARPMLHCGVLPLGEFVGVLLAPLLWKLHYAGCNQFVIMLLTNSFDYKQTSIVTYSGNKKQ